MTPFLWHKSVRYDGLAHHKKINELRNILGEDLLVISYESFALHTEKIVKKLQYFLKLNIPIPKPNVKKQSLQKWKTQLSDDTVRQIQNIVGFPPLD